MFLHYSIPFSDNYMHAAHIYLRVIIDISTIHVKSKNKTGTREKKYNFHLIFLVLFDNSKIKKAMAREV